MIEEQAGESATATTIPMEKCERCGGEVRAWNLSLVGASRVCPDCRTIIEAADKRNTRLRIAVVSVVLLAVLAVAVVSLVRITSYDGSPRQSIDAFVEGAASEDEAVAADAYDRYADMNAIREQLRQEFRAREEATHVAVDAAEGSSILGHNVVVIGLLKIKDIEVTGDAARGTATFTAPCITNLGRKYTVDFVLAQMSDERGDYWRVTSVENPGEIVEVYLDE